MKLRRSGKSLGGNYVMQASAPDVPAKPETLGQWIGVVLVLGLFALIGALGSLTIVAGVRQLLSGQEPVGKALFVIAIGLVFTAVGAGYFYLRYVKKPLWDAERARLEARYPGQPWMLRKDWVARRIVHSNLGVTALLWVFNILWWGAMALIGTVNRDKILAAFAESWWNYFLVSLFVLCGLFALRLAIAVTWTHWRYGQTTLQLDTLPAYIGDKLRGTVEARLSVRPTEPLKASLICENLTWIRTRSGGKTSHRLKVTEIARVAREIPAALVLMSQKGARIPVEIDVPAGSKEFDIDSEGNGIRWTLNVDAPGAKQPFSCTFEVPVYARQR